MIAKATYEGGCHCGKMRFRVRGDLGTAGVCDCSICTKIRCLDGVDPSQIQTRFFDGKNWEQAIQGHLPWRDER
jgi:hypothetical protein